MEDRGMVEVTAKIKCTRKQPWGDIPGADVMLEFQADYQDGRNKEWASATPALSLSMTVKSSVAEHFESGRAYTLTFTPEEG
jgi:hypothetical protein